MNAIDTKAYCALLLLYNEAIDYVATNPDDPNAWWNGKQAELTRQACKLVRGSGIHGRYSADELQAMELQRVGYIKRIG